MRLKKIAMAGIIIWFSYITMANADAPASQPSTMMQAQQVPGQPPPQGPAGPPFMVTNINDTQVQSAAAFAANQVGGTLSQILSAQKQDVGDVNYIMIIDIQNSKGQHQLMRVLVSVPQGNKPMNLRAYEAVK